MFTIDPKTTEKDLKKKNIYKVLLSMNSHQVATPETSLEEARSYVFIFREGRNRLSAYIGLHLLLTDRKLIYKHSANPFLENELSEIEDEARDFAEYMGAMMDEVDLAGMSDSEQDSWIESQGIFSTKTEPEAVPVEQPPVPEVVVSAPAPQPPTAPGQPAPAPAAEAISAPEPPAAPIKTLKPLPKAYPAETKERPRQAPVTETVQLEVQATPPAETKRSGETAQKEATTGIETPPKKTAKKTSFIVTSVVSRDREALARLLTSF
ncbi:MAG: hypothetical protein M0R70_03400 [Nitrospirae bacterium]|nr:hypothetical protein [Nitrospirota bacterium]